MSAVRLPDSIFSQQDLASLVLEIRNYARWFAHESIKKRTGITKTSEQPLISAAASQLIHDCSAEKHLTQTNLDELIKVLEDYKTSAPTLTFTLPAPPTNSVKSQLVGWCRINIAPNILVTFSFNQGLLGGMVVKCGSRIFDWSFRRQILDNRGRFPEILRSVR